MSDLYRVIEEFPNYRISVKGEIVNITTGVVIQSTRFNPVNVILRKDGRTYHRSVRRLRNKAWPDEKKW